MPGSRGRAREESKQAREESKQCPRGVEAVPERCLEQDVKGSGQGAEEPKSVSYHFDFWNANLGVPSSACVIPQG